MEQKKMEKLDLYAMPVGRVLIALIFIMFGMNKIFNYEATAGWMDAMGAPSFLLPGVIALEVLGGLAIIVGWQTRWVALALAGFSILSAIIFHNNFSDQTEMANFMKNIAISGGFLFLFANGAGRWSLDNLKQV
jgi:putative oxidoreductase